jgi:hypothetical protein
MECPMLLNPAEKRLKLHAEVLAANPACLQ